GDAVQIVAEANGFLYKMMRSLAGALVDVGRGRFDEKVLQTALESGERSELIQTAPARGLFLERVFYKGDARPDAEAAPSRRNEREGRRGRRG
ncbi:MAG: tRNA pseudouridine(38-40) synthase TruA, partial [Verrucomicrobiota bacterium]